MGGTETASNTNKATIAVSNCDQSPQLHSPKQTTTPKNTKAKKMDPELTIIESQATIVDNEDEELGGTTS